MAIAVVMTCLALPGKTRAEETAFDPAQTGTIQASTTRTTRTDSPDISTALLRVIALRQELEAQVKALSRLVAYQQELLDLANTRDVEAALRARRPRQSCRHDLNTAALCEALRLSFIDENHAGTTVQDAVQDVGQDVGQDAMQDVGQERGNE